MKSIILALLLMVCAPALAQAGALPLPPGSRTLTMSGQGEVKAVPDTVTLSAGVMSQAPSATAALAANTLHMQSVFATLKKLGVADKDIQTANFSISPRTQDDGSPRPRITGYQVNNQVRLRLDDVGKLGAALDALADAGANQISGVDFAIRDPAPLLAQARADAVAQAKAKAQTYAEAAGVTLGPILSISENDGASPRPLFMAAPMLRAAKAVPVAAGQQSVSATVSIVWEIR